MIIYLLVLNSVMSEFRKKRKTTTGEGDQKSNPKLTQTRNNLFKEELTVTQIEYDGTNIYAYPFPKVLVVINSSGISYTNGETLVNTSFER